VSYEPAKENRRRLKQAFQADERRRELESCPLPLQELHEILDAVSRLVFDECGRAVCDRTHSLTSLVLQTRGTTNADDVIGFLRSKGFNCSCEVALNLGSWLECNTPRGQSLHS
jgi:hypothetical protein